MSRNLKDHYINKKITCFECKELVSEAGYEDHMKSRSHQINYCSLAISRHRERIENFKFERKVVDEEIVYHKKEAKELIQRLNDLKHPKYTPDNTETDNIAVLAETSDTI